MHKHTLLLSPPPTGHSILPYSLTYDNIGADEYIRRETIIDNIFVQYFYMKGGRLIIQLLF
jgi:hypothetical protein